MKKRILLAFSFLLITFTALTFLTNPGIFENHNNNDVTNSTDTNQTLKKVETEVIKANTITLALNDTLTDIANFIAGKKEFKTQLLKKLFTDTSWLKYANKIESTWQRLDTNRYLSIRNWSKTNLNEVNNTSYNLFYPFSGPDFLNADLFFPECDTLSMFGLEPVGTLPAVHKEWFKDSLYKYVNSLKVSLNDILQVSFFKTKDMFTELRGSELNGALHLILWFAARTSYSISHVKPIAIDYNGKITTLKQDTSYKKSPIKGIEIACVKNNKVKIIRYFSADISNHGFIKNKRLDKFIDEYNFSATLVKSASYLMHAGNFTIIRKKILNKTTFLLQDDTGIPYKNIDNKKWDITLFGTYERPINLFSMNYQEDLKKAYDSLETKALPFGIGYKYHKNESTWMFLRSKQDKSMAKL